MLKQFSLIIAKIFFYLFGYLPLPLLHCLGASLGYLLNFLPTSFRYYVTRNIELCFPNLPRAQQLRLRQQAMMELGKSFMEGPTFWVRDVQHLNGLIKKIDGLAALQADFARGHGIILLGCHMGGYYLANAFVAPNFPNTVWIYKPQKGMVEALTQHMRDQFGANFVPTTAEGVRKMYRNLRSGYCVGMSCDHNALETSGVFAPYFNIPVATMTLAGRLAAKSKAPVYFMFMERLRKGRGFHLHIQPVSPLIYTEDPMVAATALNALLEQTVRAYPSQNEWQYRRFWDRPKGDAPLYKTQQKAL